MLSVRSYLKADYPTIRAWWKAHGAEPTPEQVLPACGLVVEADGVPVAATWVYFDNSVGVCWLAWLVTRPGLSPFKADDVLRYLEGAAEEAARAQKRILMISMCRSRSLAHWLTRQGFVKNHGQVFDLVKPLV